MRVMRMLGVTLLWFTGVVLVASLSWVAINSAGREVLGSAVTVADPRSSSGGGALAVAGPTPSVVTSPAPPSPSAKPTTTGRKPSPGGADPAATGSPGSRTPVRTPTSTPAVPTSTTPTVSPMADTMATIGGVVWLECTGPNITDLLAQPNNGWSVGRALRGTQELDVRFARSGVSIDVTATCRDGQPHFDVHTSHHEGDD